MKKLVISIFLALIIFSRKPITVKAELDAGSSAVPKFAMTQPSTFDYRVYTLRKFLGRFDSPLTPYSLEFIKTADYYGIDWRMVPAISGVESTFGKAIPSNSYNAYGWVNGDYKFKSWPDSIQTVSMTLRKNYIDKGATSISRISRIYAPPSKTWGAKVEYFEGKISPLPLSFDI